MLILTVTIDSNRYCNHCSQLKLIKIPGKKNLCDLNIYTRFFHHQKAKIDIGQKLEVK